MYPISSSLTSQKQDFLPVRGLLAEHGFTLGGNWDYDRGSFDCALDQAHKVWLRLPFDVTNGTLDSETKDHNATIRFGAPYVLRHVYQEGLDGEAREATWGAVFNQFSDPADADAGIESHWIDEAVRRVREIESILPSE